MAAPTKPLSQLAVLKVRVGTRCTNRFREDQPCKREGFVSTRAPGPLRLGYVTSTSPQSHLTSRHARLHVAKLTKRKITELGWELLDHPPYNPDLSRSKFCMLHVLLNKIQFGRLYELASYGSETLDLLEPSKLVTQHLKADGKYSHMKKN
ncbi:hypothetical protein KIN20_024899 [Parelaphostrongylus tenuis]|uniref:Histone-lysine N-methyltransferase SETMAR n=1 Tax=Parelaphostrongylus tenuis TaxID=148309 RepID=A0AAD5MU84_PARTN|nr:hypothetical protein KIN20_024899 [Parelaphostrongylus tenuis]